MRLPQAKNHKELSTQIGCDVDVVDCSSLPTGTHKILKAERAFEAIKHETTRDPILISSGNYARAVKYMADMQRRRVVIVMSGEAPIKEELESDFVEIVDIDEIIRSYREALKKFHDLPEKNLITPYLNYAYNAFIGRRLLDWTTVNITNLDDIEGQEDYKINTPLYTGINTGGYSRVFCPNGSGELFYSLVRNNNSYGTFYGISPENHPSITQREFTPESFKGSAADKLVTPVYPIWYSHFSPLIELESTGCNVNFADITEKEIGDAHELSLEHGFDVECSASVSLAYLLESFRARHKIVLNPSERVLFVMTGKGRQEMPDVF